MPLVETDVRPKSRGQDDRGLVHYTLHVTSKAAFCYETDGPLTALRGQPTQEPVSCLWCLTLVFP